MYLFLYAVFFFVVHVSMICVRCVFMSVVVVCVGVVAVLLFVSCCFPRFCCVLV